MGSRITYSMGARNGGRERSPTIDHADGERCLRADLETRGGDLPDFRAFPRSHCHGGSRRLPQGHDLRAQIAEAAVEARHIVGKTREVLAPIESGALDHGGG